MRAARYLIPLLVLSLLGCGRKETERKERIAEPLRAEILARAEADLDGLPGAGKRRRTA